MNATTPTTKVTGLTFHNIDALTDMEVRGLQVTIGKTIATFPGTPAEALEALDVARNKLAQEYGTRGHPVASIPAVRRKIAKQIT